MHESYIPGKGKSRNNSQGAVIPLEIAIGKSLIPCADNFIIPEALNAAERCSKTWGFDIKPIRVYDDPSLDSHEYRVFIMGKYRGVGYLKKDFYFTKSENEKLPEDSCDLIVRSKGGVKYYWVPYLKKEVLQDKGSVLVCPFNVLRYRIMHIIDNSADMLYTPFALIKSIRETENNASSFFFSIPDWITYFNALYQLNKKLLSEGFPVNNVNKTFEIIINNASLIKDSEGLYKIVREEIKKSFTPVSF